MKPRRLWLLCCLLATSICCCLAGCERKVARFEHLQHLNVECGGPGQPQCLSCSTCHGKVEKTAHETPPWVKTCENCHEDGVDLMNRSLRFARAQSERVERIMFPHDKHLALGPIHGQCVRCHAGVVDKEQGPARSPPMSKCLECHQRDFERANCTPCHIRQELSRLLPQTFLRHNAAWLERHGVSAARQANICQSCHSQTWCADCHDQRRGLPIEQRKPDSIERQFKHVGDFLVRHSIEARSRPATCLRCHNSESCDSCHIARGVSAARSGAANRHPIGWMGRDTNAPSFHGRAARRDPLSCMACHDHGPATNCIQCHRVGGGAGNPHPHGWHSNRSVDAPMCRYCHVN
jgi:hypothetical protein